MSPDPAPDQVIISIYADTHLMSFILSSAGMGLQILQADPMQFGLKTAVLERGLLVPAALKELLAEGAADQRAAKNAPATPPSSDPDNPDTDRRMWSLTLPEVVLIATAADFAASAYLTSFGAEMREVQVDHNGIPAVEFEAQINETLGYLGRFQDDWRALFGGYASYHQRMLEMAELRAAFAE